MTFHHITQNGVQFKTYVMFICEIFRLMCSDWLTETTESETPYKGEYYDNT
jgi:hypothetical protein